MAVHKLTRRFIEMVRANGSYGDGGGLWLQVRSGGDAKSWLFRWTDRTTKLEKLMGLGSAYTIDVDRAREEAKKWREVIHDGGDPLEVRRKEELDRRLAAAKLVTFAQCAEEWLATYTVTWVRVTAKNNRNNVDKYILPKLGHLPIQTFDMRTSRNAVDLVEEVLRPLWTTKTPTALAVQQLIETILNWAIAKQYIAGDNAASLKGPLGMRLPPAKTFYVPNPYPAMPQKQIGAFMAKLRGCTAALTTAGSCLVCASPRRAEIEAALRAGATYDSLVRRFGISRRVFLRHRQRHLDHPNVRLPRPIPSYAFELLILVGARKTQVLATRWDEIDWEHGLVIYPWMRADGTQGHKTGKATRTDHIVVLSKQALDVLKAMQELQKANGVESKYVFPTSRRGTARGHMTEGAVKHFFRRSLLKSRDVTIHGFRTTFKSWCREEGYDDDDSEMAIGHLVGRKTSRIYARNANRIEKVRLMMQAWSDYCDRIQPPPSDVAAESKVANFMAAHAAKHGRG